MDGTGALFSDFLSHYDDDFIIIPLPQHGSQDHTSLSNMIENQLPKEDCVLKNRLKVMSQQQLPATTFDIPVIYIQAKNDRLISDEKSREFSLVFTNIKYINIEGPHFILQAKPKESASLVAQLIKAGEL